MKTLLKYTRRGCYALVAAVAGSAMWLFFKFWDWFGTPPYFKMVGGMVWAALTGQDMAEDAFLSRIDALLAKTKAFCNKLLGGR